MKAKTKIKRCLTLLVVISMLAVQSAALASASVYEKGEISYFNSFSSYDGGIPNGWTTRRAALSTGLTAAVDAERESRVLRIPDGKETILPFNANFDSGMLHLSYDVKQTGDRGDANSYNQRMLVSVIGNKTTAESHEYDYTSFPDMAQSLHDIFRSGTKSLGVPVSVTNKAYGWYGAAAYDESKLFETEQWHKVDIFIDQDTKEYRAYLDGVLIEGRKYANGAYGDSADSTLAAVTDFADTESYGNGSTRNLKGLRFRADSENLVFGGNGSGVTLPKTGAFYIDNVYTSSYRAADILTDDIAVNAETANGASVGSGGRINVSLSEYINGDITKANVSVINEDTGNAITDYTVSGFDGSSFNITLGDSALTSGRYTVTVSGTEGAITGKTVNASDSFIVSSASNNAANTKYYFMNEDFNDFGAVYGNESVDNFSAPYGWAESAPNQWVKSNYSKWWTAAENPNAKNGELSAEVRAEGDNALKMHTDASGTLRTSYHFDRGVASGNFTLEFDIKYSENAAWTVGLLPFENYDNVYTYHGYASGKTNADLNSAAITQVNNRASLGAFIGALNDNGAVAAPKVGITTKTGPSVWTMKEISGAQITPGTWTNVKVDINSTTGVYNITITPQGGTASTHTYTDSLVGRFMRGVTGVSLRSSKGDTVCFDNIKVYKNDSYLINDDFAGYTAENTAYNNEWVAVNTPGGWYNLSDVRQGASGNGAKANRSFTRYAGTDYNVLRTAWQSLQSGQGVNGDTDTTDRAMRIFYRGGMDSSYAKAFSHPVSGGTPFAIEFDVMSNNDSVGWQIHQLGQDSIMPLYSYNVEHYLNDGTATQATWQMMANQKSYANNVLIGRNTGKKLVYTNADKKVDYIAETGRNAWVTDSDRTLETDKWYNIKIFVKPVSAEKTEYTVYIQEKGDEDADGFTFTTNRDWFTKSTAGIAFTRVGSNDTGNTGSSAFIDNVKVYEYETTETVDGLDINREKTDFANESVTAVNVEYSDGTSEPLRSGAKIGRDAKKITVSFSAPIAERTAAQTTQPTNAAMTSNGSGTKTFEGVYDVLEDVITLRPAGALTAKHSKNVKYNGVLSDDGKTYTMELTSLLSPDMDYVLNVSRNISFKGSAYAQIENPQRIRFTAENTSGLKLSGANLVYQAGNVWVPLTKAELLTADTKLKLRLDGINLSENAEQLFFGYAQYTKNGEAETLTHAGYDMVTAGALAPIDVNNSAELDLSKGCDIFKAFIWEKDTMRPLLDSIVIK